MTKQKIQIFVAAHKKVTMPLDQVYSAIQVGSALNKPFEGFIHDDSGKNISEKNPFFNELTAVYWARFNSDADVIGLVHYRRFFSYSKQKNLNKILTATDLDRLFDSNDVILPKKRRYWIESSESHYRHAHHDLGLDTVRQVISEKYPSYLKSYDSNMSRNWAHMFNMFIMRREYFDAYTDWLFDILFETEKRIQSTVDLWSPYEQRVYGFLSERLLDVWIEYNQIAYKEIPVTFMEKQNWILKGGKFLARKFGIR